MRVFLALFAIVAAMRAGAIPRLMWNGPAVNLLGSPSRDGRFLSYVDPETRNLAIREIHSGKTAMLTSRQGREFAYFSAIARDSQKVAYAWFNAEGFYELRVVNTDGTGQRVLFRNEEAGFVQPCAWTPGDQHVLTLLFRKDNISQIALVPLDGSPVKVLRSLMWVYPKRMDLSPSGGHIVYDSFTQGGSGERSIFILEVNGQAETRLIDTPGNYSFPLWASDGKSVLFLSDHGGTTDLWSASVQGGKAQAKPQIIRRDLGRVLPLGVTAAGEYIYGLRAGETDVFVTTWEDPQAHARRASLRFPGRNSNPVWSPDGNMLAYLSRRGSENFGQESRSIVIRSLASGAEREITPQLAHIERVRWSSDQAHLLVSGSDGKGRGGLFSLDVRTTVVTPVIREADAPVQGYEGVWRGNDIVYNYRSTEIRTPTSVIYRGANLHHLTASPDGKLLAVISDGKVVVIGDEPREIPFAGATELEWANYLVAARGTELWRIPLEGTIPVPLKTPGNRRPGFSAHPDGNRVALTVSNARSEIWLLKVQ